MQELVSNGIENYCVNNSEKVPNYLQALERETNIKTMQPIMLSGALQGRFLSTISHLLKPNCILEIGTFTGYSALCLAEGLAHNGVLHTIDINAELEPIVSKYFKTVPFASQLNMHFGKALEIIPNLNIQPDIVFIDADKTNYINYYEMVLPMLTNNGVIIADNVLFHGQVLDEHKSKNAAAIFEFNTHIANDNRVVPFMLPLRDGLTIIRKK
jgi:caffeoyl-CoA O-methyltransferase